MFNIHMFLLCSNNETLAYTEYILDCDVQPVIGYSSSPSVKEILVRVNIGFQDERN